MDSKALFNLSYGVFFLGTKSGDKLNACITNTCIQIASDPVRVAISVLNKNLTCEMIKESGFFALSVLDKSVDFVLMQRFGMQSGRNVNKLLNFDYKVDANGCPYITEKACSLLSCKVVSSENLGSHTLFIAEVLDANILSSKSPVTYGDYQNDIKPKAGEKKEKKIIGWRCTICGFELMEKDLPDDYTCPLCGHPKDDFEPIYED